MAYISPNDRVRETSADTGPGDYALAATSDFRRFSAMKSPGGAAIANGDLVDYAIILGSAFEVGVCPWNNNVLLRSAGTVKASSNGGALVSFGAGTKDIFNDAGAHVLNAMLRFDVDQQVASADQKRARRNAGIDITTLSKNANYTAVAADYGALFKLSGTATLAFAAAATLGDGWKCDIRNTSTGIWELDPNGSETINGKTTLKIYPGESCRIDCDGTGLHAIGLSTGMVLIEEIVANNSFSAMIFKNFDSNRFRGYVFKFNQILAAVAGAEFISRVYNDGGVTPITSAIYVYGRTLVVGSGSQTFNSSNSNSYFSLYANSNNSNTAYGSGGTLNMLVGADATFFDYALSYVQAGTTLIAVSGAGSALIGGVNAVQFIFGTGNIFSGSITMYGIPK